MLLSLLFSQPLVFLLVMIALIVSISIHEFAHAYAADKLGDDTPRLLGRLTLNPLSHLDPIGTLLLIIAGFGWGNPVPFNPINLKNPKRDSALIALAGPVSNFTLALLLISIHKALNLDQGILGSFIYITVLYNFVLGTFNLIPIYPLDGFKIVAGFLNPNLYIQWMATQQYGSILLLVLVFTGATGVVVTPIINFLMNLFAL